MANVPSQLPTMLNPPTSVARPGIGTIKFASNAPTDGLSTPMVFVFPYLTTVDNITLLEPVSHVTRDTTSLMANVPSQLPTMLNPPTSVARPGIGTTKYVLSAPIDGHSMLTGFAFPSQITVKVTMLQELVLNASTDTD